MRGARRKKATEPTPDRSDEEWQPPPDPDTGRPWGLRDTRRSINRIELIEKIAESTGETRSTVDAILNGLFATLAESMSAGTKVTIPGWLAVERTHRAARSGRDPQTGATIEIPAGHRVRISAGSRLKAAADLMRHDEMLTALDEWDLEWLLLSEADVMQFRQAQQSTREPGSGARVAFETVDPKTRTRMHLSPRGDRRWRVRLTSRGAEGRVRVAVQFSSGAVAVAEGWLGEHDSTDLAVESASGDVPHAIGVNFSGQ